jgi:hypothetical protein
VGDTVISDFKQIPERQDEGNAEGKFYPFIQGWKGNASGGDKD